MVIHAPPFPLIFISSETQVSPKILQTYSRLQALLYTVWIHIQIPHQPSGCGLYCWVSPLHYWPPRDQTIPQVRGTLYICLCILTMNAAALSVCRRTDKQLLTRLLQRKGRHAGQLYISALHKQSSIEPDEFKLFKRKILLRFQNVSLCSISVLS